MRYVNWDVLLFPEESKVPIQEFKTGCFVVQDPEFSQPVPHTSQASGYALEHTLPRQLPTVASFVASLPSGCPFRVSIHSWEPPVASKATQIIARQGSAIYFEARVLIDGVCIGGVLFNHQGPWPQVVDTSSHVDKEGNRDSLLFPAFHQEMLTQNWWNAGENMGRIKVIITEGHLQGHNGLPFVRAKNVVSFSFQHAPLNILENSGIAWPNPGMWYQPSQPLYSIASPTKLEASDPELHAHSPRRRDGSIGSLRGRITTTIPSPLSTYRSMPPPPIPGSEQEAKASQWTSSTLMPDPFVENGRRFMQTRYMARSSEEDQLMPDYSQSITPASSRNATNDFTILGGPSSVLPNNDPQFDELINTLRSRNENSSGTSAPANTRASSAANTPPIQTRPSAAAEARAASYSQGRPRAVSMTSRDVPPPMSCENSDASMNFLFSEEKAGIKDQANPKVLSKPTSDVKSRKEGKASELEPPSQIRRKSSKNSISKGDKENTKATITTTVVLSDGKRKRATTIAGPNVAYKEGEVLDSSPTRKVSKKDTVGGPSEISTDELTEEGMQGRAPLVLLDNVL